MNEQEQYEAIKFINRQERLIKSIENKQAIEHQLEQISQLVNKLEKHLEERGIIWVQEIKFEL